MHDSRTRRFTRSLLLGALASACALPLLPAQAADPRLHRRPHDRRDAAIVELGRKSDVTIVEPDHPQALVDQLLAEFGAPED